MLPALQCRYHFIDKVIDIEQFQFYRRVVDLNGQVVSDIVAESRHGGIVIRTTPLAEKVRETVDQHFRSGLF